MGQPEASFESVPPASFNVRKKSEQRNVDLYACLTAKANLPTFTFAFSSLVALRCLTLKLMGRSFGTDALGSEADFSLSLWRLELAGTWTFFNLDTDLAINKCDLPAPGTGILTSPPASPKIVSFSGSPVRWPISSPVSALAPGSSSTLTVGVPTPSSTPTDTWPSDQVTDRPPPMPR